MVTRSGVKVDGQGQGIGHWVKSGEGSRLGDQVRGQGLRVKVWGLRFGGQGRGQCLGVMVRGSRSGS